MKINVAYLKKFVAFDLEDAALKELLAGIGLETAETLQVDGQTVLEIEITPNRPDWLSHYGIAREIAAKDAEARFLPMAVEEWCRWPRGEKDSPSPSKTPRTAGATPAAIVRDVQVGESDPAVQKLLISLGLRPINNIVDVSNLVMMTCGQPLHIFDLERLQGNQIRVRRARKNETIRLLDGREVALDENYPPDRRRLAAPGPGRHHGRTGIGHHRQDPPYLHRKRLLRSAGHPPRFAPPGFQNRCQLPL